jgi:ABC-type Fe3+/spermidine/putrescine transport system ATPase subunit
MADRPVILQIKQVVKNFGNVHAVNGVNLNIHEGEFFALLGPSGCGKTTLLRMLAGFEFPSEGSIKIDGKETRDIPPEPASSQYGISVVRGVSTHDCL